MGQLEWVKVLNQGILDTSIRLRQVRQKASMRILGILVHATVMIFGCRMRETKTNPHSTSKIIQYYCVVMGSLNFHLHVHIPLQSSIINCHEHES